MSLGTTDAMSWDLFIQDLPSDANVVADISDDFRPGPLGGLAEVTAMIRDFEPTIDFTDPLWWRLEGLGFSIEFNVGDDDPLEAIALHVRGGEAAVGFVDRLLKHCGWKALDTGAGEIFARQPSAESMQTWKQDRATAFDGQN